MNENTRPLMVSIWCITYNHEPYIRQCLEGFVMQKTNFHFEAIVHDDASTDGTAAIVREYAEKYPDIIKPILETENQYSKHDGTLDRIMDEKCTGKYIALCEGDDYWIDPLKLQKQVDAFEKDKTVSCVHTAFKTIDKDGTEIPRPFYDSCMKKSHSGNVLRTLINGNYVMTLTTMIREDVLRSCIYTNCPVKFDLALIYAAAMMGNFIYIPKITGCYRKTPDSAMDLLHSGKSDQYSIGGSMVYSYYSKLIINNRNISFIDKCYLRLHILVQLFRNKDMITMHYILKKDTLSRILYPISFLYKIIFIKED